MPRRVRLISTTLIPILLTAGCGDPPDPDQRLADMATRSLDAQATQNEQMAEQSRRIAEATEKLVEADAQARRELVQAQADLQKGIEEERSGLDRQREEMERERRELAKQRHRDPIVARAIGAVGIALACLAPLALAAYVLYTLNRASDESEALGELLITEIAADEPNILPPPHQFARIGHTADEEDRSPEERPDD